MNAQHISDALALLDDDLLEEANAARSGGGRRARRLGGMAAAACLALLVGVGAVLHGGRSAPGPEVTGLPQLPISEMTSGGMGFEGYMAYDVSELISGSPWREGDEFKTLPVYRNRVKYDAGGAPVGGVDLEAMKTRALEAASRLGVSVEVQAPEEWELAGGRITARGDGVEITVTADLTASVWFDPALELPQEYNFGYYAPYGDMKKVSDYLLEQYGGLLDMEEPQMEPTGGDYTFSGEQGYEIAAYDAAGDKTQRLLSYSFAGAAFSCDDQGRLWLVRLQGEDLSEKVGDYPIVTTKAAKKLLSEGKYLTSAPYELPGMEYVQKVELVYRTGRGEDYFMPYYRFLVQLPQEERENGLHTYGAYYVPAVEEAYLTGLSVWDGSFNS